MVINGVSDLSDLFRPLALPVIAVIFIVSVVLMEILQPEIKEYTERLGRGRG